MINYEKTNTSYEFLFMTEDGRHTAAQLSLSFSEEDKVKYLTSWFNQILRALNDPPSQ